MSTSDPLGIVSKKSFGDPLGIGAKKANADPLGLGKQYGGGAAEPQGLLQKIQAGSAKAASVPLGAVNAVVNAPERFVQGLAGGSPGNPLGNAAYDVFHPNDEATQSKELSNIEAKAGIHATGLGRAAADFGAQTLLDPLTYIPFIGEGKLALRAAEGAGKLGSAALHASPAVAKWSEAHVTPVLNFFRSDPRLAQKFGGDQNAMNVYKGVYQTEASRQIKDMQTDALLLDRAKPQLEAGIIPPEIQQRLQLAAPTAHFVDMPNEGSLYSAVAKRLELGSAKRFEDSVNQRMINEYGAGALSPEGYKAFQGLEGPVAKTVARQGAKQGPLQALTNLADVYRAALFINPLPHMFNIARLAYLAGGMRTVGRGLKYFASGVPEDVEKRLGTFVGRPEYLSGERSAGERVLNKVIPGSQQVRDVGQKALSNFDAAMRASYMKELEGGAEAAGARGYNIGEDVRQGLGEYQDTSQFATGLKQLGAPFASWRLGIVPKAVGRALARNPERVGRYARAGTDIRQNTGVEFGGPVEDFSKFASAPVGTSRYIESTLPILQWLMGMQGKGIGDKQALAQAVRAYVPLAGSAEEAAGLSPYGKESKDKLLNFLLSLAGGYTQSK